LSLFFSVAGGCLRLLFPLVLAARWQADCLAGHSPADCLSDPIRVSLLAVLAALAFKALFGLLRTLSDDK